MKNKIAVIGIVIFCIIALIVFLCIKNINRNSENNKESDNFKIVTSFYPIYIIAENVTKGACNIELSNMAELNGGCLHDYTLSTSDVKKLEDADVFIENGVGIEKFTDKLLQIYSDLKIIDSSIELTDIIESGEEENGHTWMGIENYKKQTLNIAKIEEINKKYKERLSNLSGEKVICLNESFEYLGRDLNLDMIMVETDHEESTLSADRLKSLIEQAKENNIKMIIIGEDDNTQNAETISSETGAKIYKLKTGMSGNYSENSYIEDLEYNLEQLSK